MDTGWVIWEIKVKTLAETARLGFEDSAMFIKSLCTVHEPRPSPIAVRDTQQLKRHSVGNGQGIIWLYFFLLCHVGFTKIYRQSRGSSAIQGSEYSSR